MRTRRNQISSNLPDGALFEIYHLKKCVVVIRKPNIPKTSSEFKIGKRQYKVLAKRNPSDSALFKKHQLKECVVVLEKLIVIPRTLYSSEVEDNTTPCFHPKCLAARNIYFLKSSLNENFVRDMIIQVYEEHVREGKDRICWKNLFVETFGCLQSYTNVTLGKYREITRSTIINYIVGDFPGGHFIANCCSTGATYIPEFIREMVIKAWKETLRQGKDHLNWKELFQKNFRCVRNYDDITLEDFGYLTKRTIFDYAVEKIELEKEQGRLPQDDSFVYRVPMEFQHERFPVFV